MWGFKHFITEAAVKQKPWLTNPKLGWWLDNPKTWFFHGTHKNNLEGILESGIYAPSTGPTAGWVSLALDPYTAFGYASMYGGESAFRAAGAKPKTALPKERVIFAMQIPQTWWKPKMAEARGNMDTQREKLNNRKLYDDWKSKKGKDFNYYELTEIRVPKLVPAEFIKFYMYKVKS